MHGFLLIDKPAGITSHDIVRQIRRKLHIKRVGHGGTLDPMATGLVPVAIGDATRLLEFYSDSDKGYSATMRLGVTTDSQDAEGEVVATADWQSVTPDTVEQTLTSMQGDLDQVPPMFSALKKDGTPLYKLARQGIEVERKARRITIRSIAMTACELPSVSFDVVCSKGTYIRTLAHDVGQSLGCGAHLTALRRFRHGPYEIAAAIRLEDFVAASDEQAAAMLIPLLEMLPDLPLGRLSDEAIPRLLNGIPPQSDEVDFDADCVGGDIVRLVAGGRLLAVAEFDPARTREKRGDFILSRVFTCGQ
ncbi:MAG: tRNA pseudouridine(55) synthase TruB [Desulfuromonas sp.]|nr:MAG: tRNA pseudouridine(55) synthase TruB [Desulfuromonas sp.]